MMADGGVIYRLPRKKVHYQVETIFETSRRIICEAQDLLEPHNHADTFILILCSVAFDDKEGFVSKRFCESWDVLGHTSFTHIQGYDGPAMDSKKQEQVDSTRFPGGGGREGAAYVFHLTLPRFVIQWNMEPCKTIVHNRGVFPLPLSLQLVVTWLKSNSFSVSHHFRKIFRFKQIGSSQSTMIWVDWGLGRLTMYAQHIIQIIHVYLQYMQYKQQQNELENCEFSVAMIPGVLALICGCQKDIPINPSKTHVTKKREAPSQKISTLGARNKSFSCSFGVGPRWQGPVSEMVMTGALARYDRPRLWRLHAGDGYHLLCMERLKKRLPTSENRGFPDCYATNCQVWIWRGWAFQLCVQIWHCWFTCWMVELWTLFGALLLQSLSSQGSSVGGDLEEQQIVQY